MLCEPLVLLGFSLVTWDADTLQVLHVFVLLATDVVDFFCWSESAFSLALLAQILITFEYCLAQLAPSVSVATLVTGLTVVMPRLGFLLMRRALPCGG
jgi:hypothetical protein